MTDGASEAILPHQTSVTPAPPTPSIYDCHCYDCRLERTAYTSFAPAPLYQSSARPCHHSTDPKPEFSSSPSELRFDKHGFKPSSDEIPKLIHGSRAGAGTGGVDTGDNNGIILPRVKHSAESVLRRRNSVIGGQTDHEKNMLANRLIDNNKVESLNYHQMGFIDVSAHREALPSSSQRELFTHQLPAIQTCNPLEDFDLKLCIDPAFGSIGSPEMSVSRPGEFLKDDDMSNVVKSKPKRRRRHEGRIRGNNNNEFKYMR